MRGIKKLHNLIQALTKTEKRYISIELSKQKSKKGEIDLKLFDLLKKQNTLDEDKINCVPEFNSTLKLIIRSKYLFEFVLRCLIDYYHSREIEIAIGNHIRIIKIFILKGLHEYTHQHLNKAEKLVGEIHFWQDTHGRPRMGYHIAPLYQGQGLASEAHKACIEWSDGVLPVPVTRAEFLSDNHASEAVLRKSGFHRTGEMASEVPGFEDKPMVCVARTLAPR